ncbi:staygreen family protein [Peribacillus acanthi]|uniref:staygreen family protein n=1 Tax=Peribacillus acanthi TaxID=2171554 RepID=UPI000D3E676F|nr:staygreen family protein [Peribacillus acanthi]
MSTFNPEKLNTTFIPPATPYSPVDGRKYTMTHSDTTGELFVSIGCDYDWGKINPHLRDEVLAEWRPNHGEYSLQAKVYISGGEFDYNNAKVRFLIFERELPLAFSAIFHADETFFHFFPWFLDFPIYVHYQSIYPEFQKTVYAGTPRQYLVKKS